MGKGEMKVQNRRHSRDMEEFSGWQILWKMGMPLLYVLAFLSGIVGIICNGIISHYWSNLLTPMCFLYSRTPSTIGYTFGSAVANCHWVTYGATVGVVLLFLCALLYFIKVRSSDDPGMFLYLLLICVVLATIFLLAVSCTLAEGMRVTCASMGINSANNKGESCYDKLEQRVQQYSLPVSTASMVQAAMYSLWGSTVFSAFIAWFHLRLYFRSL
ncbi:uncharacterized protein LOC134774045 [Penaeus indicus]|uniref:uncharacterized protein LOC134774045 n=1 Tax=Penaeus indicus TaxID=29960 RepID=UPI00300DA381